MAQETTEARQTPLTALHRELGARLVPFAGYAMPIQYQGIKKEHQAVREAAGLFDVSHMGELRVTGAAAAKFVNHLVTNDLDRIEPGRAMYTCCCAPHGGILDDLIVYKNSEQDVLIVCNASNRAKIGSHVCKQVEGWTDVGINDESEETALLALQGPRAFDVLSRTDKGLSRLDAELRPFRFKKASLAGVPMTVARTGYTGEDGVELFCAAERAATVWRALLDSGEDLGISPVGLGARDTLRLEARLSLYGNELSETVNPIEAGLAWTVKLDKQDFIGKSAIAQVQEQGPGRTIVGFEMLGRGIARTGYSIKSDDGETIGECTSGAPSPTLGKAIGLGFVRPEFAQLGTSLLIDCRGKDIAAQVVKTPFYKRA